MFERYNAHARRAIFFARHAAGQSGSRTIESEHLLLGLVHEAGSLFARVAPGVSFESLRQTIPLKAVVENPSMRIHMPLSSECKRILSYSAEEANDLDHPHIGAEHLLLAILREQTCLAARLLAEMDVRIDSLHQELALAPAPSKDLDSRDPRSAEARREAIHALIDRIPEALLVHVKAVIDQVLSRPESAGLGRERGTIVKASFSSGPMEKEEVVSEPGVIRAEPGP